MTGYSSRDLCSSFRLIPTMSILYLFYFLFTKSSEYATPALLPPGMRTDIAGAEEAGSTYIKLRMNY